MWGVRRGDFDRADGVSAFRAGRVGWLDALRPLVDEVEWARQRSRSDEHLLGLVLGLKCFQRLGYFPRDDQLPEAVVERIRASLGLTGGVVRDARDRTARWQQELASVRRVARNAGVDPALVYHYFADKPGLFVACLDLPVDPRIVQVQAQQGQLSGSRIVERFLAQWEDDSVEPGRSFVTLTQAVSSAPEVARALRQFLTERVWAHRADGDEEATARTAALVSSQLLGAAWARYVVRMEPFASASRAEVAAWIGPTIEAYITGRLPTAQTPSQPIPDDQRSRRPQARRRGT